MVPFRWASSLASGQLKAARGIVSHRRAGMERNERVGSENRDDTNTRETGFLGSCFAADKP